MTLRVTTTRTTLATRRKLMAPTDLKEVSALQTSIDEQPYDERQSGARGGHNLAPHILPDEPEDDSDDAQGT